MLKLFQDLQNAYPYTLSDIMEICGFESIHSTRKYKSKVLPRSCIQKQGEKRGARYNENTLNSFKVLKLILDKKLLTWEQITNVMSALTQDQINRIARGDEPLRVQYAFTPEQAQQVASGESAKEKVLLIDGDDVSEIAVSETRRTRKSDEDGSEDIRTIDVSERLQLRVKGELSQEQVQELEIASRILKSIVDG